ncbi:Na+/H+ antiporter NhaC family protein [Leucobacter chromiireducens subsp. chromiireducens]|uniref:TRAP transporter large permease subunit n=1 Tax=Leucobacter chromiireducens subsp. chromiireducens TaxID=660067 RepID=A0ABS1SU64_9MICO|nr:TRAP transporter large permease subunit [Leucobacter chromiireducens subsp. chromiireducens]
MVQNTALALLPVLTVLIVSVLTKRALFGLLSGVLVGTILLGGWAFFDTFVGAFGASLTNETVHWLALVVVLFGILIAYFNASGAANDFARWTEGFVNSRRKSLLLTWLLTIALFIDDYLNALTVGTSMKRVTDRHGVPRTMVGTIVKMTSAPIAVIIPFSTWAVFFSALLEQDGVTVNGSGFGAYLSGLPTIFFGWFALAIGLLLALGVLPLVGPLKREQARVARTGDTLPEGLTPEERAFELAEDGQQSTRPLPFNFLIPIVTLVLVTIFTEVDIIKGAAAAVVVAIILYVAQRRLTLKGVLDQAFEGITSMGYVMVLFVLAFMMQQINIDLQLADWIIDATQPVMYGALLPAVVFLVCGIYAYATGAFWDLAVVITPVVLPLAIGMGVDPVLAGTAVFSGAALGSTTCMYGDGMVLAAKSVGVKPLSLMLSILPYAGVAAVLSFIAYLIAGYASFGG